MKRSTATLLKKMGVPPHLIGYDYIGEGAELIHADRRYLRGVTTKLYPAIAKKFDTTPARVERGIRHAVETVFNNPLNNEAFEIFGSTIGTKDKPVNSHFLAVVADLLED